MDDSEWQIKNATLSDKTAQKEYGLTRDEIVQAIRAGKIQYRQTSIYGNPALRLLRREVESLVKDLRGSAAFKEQQANTELAQINRRLIGLKREISTLEKRKAELLANVGK